jgi:hypothetical protein
MTREDTKNELTLIVDNQTCKYAYKSDYLHMRDVIFMISKVM